MDVRRILFVMWKEVLELRQDPRIFGIIFIAPVVQLAVLGYAATTDVRNVPFVVVDADRSPASQDLIGRFTGSGIFELVDVVTDTRAVDRYLESGKAWMALSIPADYGEDVAAGRSASLQVLADGSDANSTNIALGYAANLVTGYSQELLQQRGRASGGAPHPAGGIEPRVRVWFNPTLESRYFMLPGIFALLLLVVTSSLSSMAIVREREVGTLEQLNVTPLGRLELILGKLLPYGLIGLIDVLIVLVVIVFWFRGAVTRKLLAAVQHEPHLPADDTRARVVHLDHFAHPAAGDDDADVLFPYPDDVSLGVRLSDREHARPHPAGDLSDTAPVFRGHPARHLLERCGSRDLVAPGAGALCLGGRHPDPRGDAVEQAIGIAFRDGVLWTGCHPRFSTACVMQPNCSRR